MKIGFIKMIIFFLSNVGFKRATCTDDVITYATSNGREEAIVFEFLSLFVDVGLHMGLPRK